MTTVPLEDDIESIADAELVAQCQRELPYGLKAYREILRRHEPLVFRSCLKLLGSVPEAEEVSQDVFLQVYHKVNQFEGRSAFKTWLYRIAYNQCMDRMRKLARRRERETEMVEEMTHRAELQRHAGAEDGEQLSEEVDHALQKMRAEDSQLIVMRYVSGLSLNEIAEVLELSLSAAKMRLYRAQEDFKKYYTAGSASAAPFPVTA